MNNIFCFLIPLAISLQIFQVHLLFEFSLECILFSKMLGILYYAESRTWISFIVCALLCMCICLSRTWIYILQCGLLCVCMCEYLFHVINIYIYILHKMIYYLFLYFIKKINVQLSCTITMNN